MLLKPSSIRSSAAAEHLVVERITDFVDLLQLRRDWDELLDERSVGAPFRSAAWLLTWWQHFSTGKVLRVYTVWRGSCLVGILPAYHVPTRLGTWQLRLLGDQRVGSDYLGLIARADEAGQVSEALARALVRAEDDVAFYGVESAAVLLEALRCAAAEVGATHSRALLTVCPYVAVDREGDYAEWLARRPSLALEGIQTTQSVATRLDRSQRWLARQPGVRMQRLSGTTDLLAAADSFWRLHHVRWAAQGGSDAIYDEAISSFHKAALRALAERGWARIFLLSVDERPAAGLYGFEHGGHFAFFQSGYDPKFRQHALGRVVLNAALRSAFESGLLDFDFLRGNEPYKRVYASGWRELSRILIGRGPRGRASVSAQWATAAARKVLRGIVPVRLVRWERRLKRGRRRWSPPVS